MVTVRTLAQPQAYAALRSDTVSSFRVETTGEAVPRSPQSFQQGLQLVMNAPSCC